MTKLKSPALLPIYLLCALALGCAKGERKEASSITERSTHKALEGSLVENAQKLIAGPYRADCDDLIEPARQEMAAALDAKKSEIEEYKKKNGNSELYKSVPFGPTYAQERIKPANPALGWTEDTTTWQEIATLYMKAKNKPVDANWVRFNDLFRGTLVDEVDRVVDGFNYQVTKDSEPSLRSLLAELNVCLAKEDCLEPLLSESAKAFFQTQDRLKEELGDVTNSATPEKKRKQLKDLVEWVEVDLRPFEFHKNPNVKMTGDGQFELPLDFGPFAQAADQVHRYFNDLWQTDGKKVSLKAVSPQAIPDLYRLLLGVDVGGRSYVMRKAKTVTLMPSLRARTVAHELGHVLGFADNYFTVWNPKTCDWKSQYREDDLMSMSSSGKVLDHHWAKLTEMYK